MRTLTAAKQLKLNHARACSIIKDDRFSRNRDMLRHLILLSEIELVNL